MPNRFQNRERRRALGSVALVVVTLPAALAVPATSAQTTLAALPVPAAPAQTGPTVAEVPEAEIHAPTPAPDAPAQATPTAPEFPEAEIHGPTPVPDRVLLTFAGDPATQQSVTWRTDDTVTTAQAQIAPAEGGPGFVANADTIEATSSAPVVADLGYPSVFHSVTFEALQPSTQYLYRVGDGTNWSEWYEFETASTEAEPFSFVYVGDAQNDIQEHWSRLIRKAYATAPDAAFVVHAGDLVNDQDSDAEWGEWFKAAGFIDGMTPSVPTAGNHEYSGSELSPYWRTQFGALPDNGPQGDGPIYDALEGTVYYVDYQGVRVISLNSNYRSVGGDPAAQAEWLDVQAEWLNEVLTANPNHWTVVTFHHPVFSTREGHDNPELRTAWMPILEDHGVDLVMQGHDHTYGRGNLATGQTRRSPGGTVYAVSVSGPKMYEASEENWTGNGAEAHAIVENTQLFQVISVDGQKLTYHARTATGEMADAFTLRKRDDGRKPGDHRQP